MREREFEELNAMLDDNTVPSNETIRKIKKWLFYVDLEYEEVSG